MLKRIHSIERLDSSTNGNPRFKIAFDDAAASPLTTSSDCGFCYAVGNPDMRAGCLVSVILTRAGRIAEMSPATPADVLAEVATLAAALTTTPSDPDGFARWEDDALLIIEDRAQVIAKLAREVAV